MTSPVEVRIAVDDSLQGFPDLDYLQWLTGDAFRLVESEQPDYVFFGPLPRPRWWPWLGPLSPRMGPRRGNFVRIFWTGENVRPDFERYDWLFTFDYDDLVRHPRHCRRPIWHREMTPGADGPRRPRFEKTKFCNFIYNNPRPVREEFFERLCCYKHVDSPGARKNNMAPIGGHRTPRASRWSPNWIAEKQLALQPYRFTIAFENSSYPGYVTEKMIQPLMADSIPIYWGNPLIARDFNPRCFINAHDFRSLDEVVAKVAEIDSDPEAYAAMQAAPFYEENGAGVLRHMEVVRRRFEQIFSLGLSCRPRP